MDRRNLQQQGKHPAPCAMHCEANAFEIELKRLRMLLREALPLVVIIAEISHISDAHRREPNNDMDLLVNRIKNEVKNESQ